MKYISAEQFRNADEKVKNSIIRWWIPEEYDFVKRDGIEYVEIIAECYGNEIRTIDEDYHISKNTFIPLLTTQQLIDYLHDFGVSIQVTYDYNRGVDVGLMSKTVKLRFFRGESLLNILWDIVLFLHDENGTLKPRYEFADDKNNTYYDNFNRKLVSEYKTMVINQTDIELGTIEYITDDGKVIRK